MPRDPNVPDFSVDAFSTNWQKLSPKAKDVLFGPDNPGTPRAGLEQLGRVTADLRNLGRMSGHSGHFGPMQAAGVSSIITELITMMSMGRAPIKELAGLSGAYGVSKMLMTPWFAKMAYAPENAARDMGSQAGRAGVVDAAIQEAGRERSDRPVRHSVAGP
jgi:hypothetical protein